ncbi:MAG: ComEC/Rec2 family competence protein [Patescibacteria group bacterium]
MQKVAHIRLIILAILLAVTTVLWGVVLRESREGILTIAVLDVGQGDAIYIEAPNGRQMLIDGGPTRSMLSELSEVMPWYDRSVDVLLVTNPDKDHFGGFIDLLKSYTVDAVFESGTFPGTQVYTELEKTIADTGVKKIVARRGMTIWLDRDVTLSILYPDRDVSGLSSNDGSIVARLSYGNTSVMLTGDTTSGVEKWLTRLDGADLKSTVLKVGHHGSRTSTSPEFVGFVAPEFAVISDGARNRYGHPHKETLDTLTKFNVPVFRTDLQGTIVMHSDGERVTIKVEP